MHRLACVLVLLPTLPARADDPRPADADPKARRLAVEALVRAGPASAPALRTALSDRDERVRLLAIDGLARFAKQSPAHVPALTAALTADAADVRIRAAVALGRLGPAAKPALPALRKATTDTGNLGLVTPLSLPRSVAEAAIGAVLTLEPGSAAELLKAAAPALIRALNSEDDAVRHAAGLALRRFGPAARAVGPDLRAALQTARRAAVRDFIDTIQAVAPDPAELLATIRAPDTPVLQRINGMRALLAIEEGDAPLRAARELLQDDTPERRMVAAFTLRSYPARAKALRTDLLARLDDDPLAAAVPRLLSGGEDPVAAALAQAGPVVVPDLVAVLADARRPPAARRRAAAALAILGRKATPALPQLRAALTDRNPTVAVEAAGAVIRADADPDAALAVIRTGLGSRDPALRRQALAVATRLRWRAEPLAAALTECLDDPDPDLRETAVQALCQLGSAAKPAAAKIAELLRRGELRQSLTLFVLAGLGPNAAPAVPVLIDFLKPPAGKPGRVTDAVEREGLRISALSILGDIGPAAADAVPALLAAMDSGSKTDADGPAEALGRIGPAAAAAVPRLRTMLNQNFPHQQAVAARALGQIGPAAKAAGDDLRRAARDDDRKVRIWSEFALARIAGDPEPHVRTLLAMWDAEPDMELAGEPNSGDYLMALRLLGADARPARDRLLANLEPGSHPGVVLGSALALANLGDDAAAAWPRLAQLAADPARPNRGLIASIMIGTLGDVGPRAKAAVPALRKLADDDDPDVADAAAAALRRIEDK